MTRHTSAGSKLGRTGALKRKVPRDARTGEFVVVKPAVSSSRFTPRQIRDAVRKVNEAEASKGK